jgi:hypothetical protein
MPVAAPERIQGAGLCAEPYATGGTGAAVDVLVEAAAIAAVVAVIRLVGRAGGRPCSGCPRPGQRAIAAHRSRRRCLPAPRSHAGPCPERHRGCPSSSHRRRGDDPGRLSRQDDAKIRLTTATKVLRMKPSFRDGARCSTSPRTKTAPWRGGIFRLRVHWKGRALRPFVNMATKSPPTGKICPEGLRH